MEHESSTIMAAVNLAKLCVGAGILALPYSFLRGGLLFSPIGIGLIALWNGISCMMIIRCKRITGADNTVFTSIPSEISSTYSKIAYAALGWNGVYLTDFSIIFTLLGVCISYQIAFISLFQDLPFNNFTSDQLAFISAIIVLPLCCVKNVSVLSIFSLAGLVILVVGILSIFIFGISIYHREDEYSWYYRQPLSLGPSTISDLTSFIGVSVFCFGLCSLAFPVEESMKNKHDFGKAVLWSLLFVWTIYMSVGDGIAWLYSHEGVKSNILQNLPKHSMIASFVRISMCAVCLLTYPLTLIPPAQMIEHLLTNENITWPQILCWKRNSYLSIPSHSHTISIQNSNDAMALRIVVRSLLIVTCSVFAALVPCFGLVVSLLGCFTVSILSFVLPPVLHLQLVTIPLMKQSHGLLSGKSLLNHSVLSRIQFTSSNSYIVQYTNEDLISPRLQYYFDIMLAILGIVICIVATFITANDAIATMRSGHRC